MQPMPTRHVVVDGSNIATEGRSTPSLAQLDAAVREFLKEFPDSNVTVVVDATFGHRIDNKEQKARRRRRGTGAPPSEPVNEPLAFIDFVGSHPLGSHVDGEVDEFTSHGAFVQIDGVRCYLPLTAMGDPPPRSARALMKRGER